MVQIMKMTLENIQVLRSFNLCTHLGYFYVRDTIKLIFMNFLLIFMKLLLMHCVLLICWLSYIHNIETSKIKFRFYCFCGK